MNAGNKPTPIEDKESFTLEKVATIMSADHSSASTKLETFYHLCKSDATNAMLQESLQLDGVQAWLKNGQAHVGLFTCAALGQLHNLETLCGFIKQHPISVNQDDLFACFNVACARQHCSVAQLIEDNFNVAGLACQQDGNLMVNEQGVFVGNRMTASIMWSQPIQRTPIKMEALNSCFFIKGSLPPMLSAFHLNFNNKLAQYQKNPLVYNARQENIAGLEILINKIKEVNLSILEEAFISCCENNKQVAIEFLWSHKLISPIIASSTEIQRYLGHDTPLGPGKRFAHGLKAFKDMNEKMVHGSTTIARKKI